ncbi:NAD(P)-binding domain-containing protein [uncultured Chryseobacterium sp.]|uniref:NAD(P)-binding domain-containing protein n=1 Tax=uncultured Chryseobacterium sp. TaxID=259322 RepID=UPI0025DA22F8|nr:NAD(P)-binding domain-containing protein [uncultured Chryseobacterium sp.]
MKKLGIIGCGWLGSYIAEHFADRYEIYATTTTETKLDDLRSKGYHAFLAKFPDELNTGTDVWEAAADLDSVVIAVPFSGLRGAKIPMTGKRQNLLNFIGDFRGRVFYASSTGIYPDAEQEFTEDDQPAMEVESENFILERFPQANILRLGGLMGGERLLKNYNISGLDQPVNHIHYTDICRVIEKMLENKSESQVYNVVAPLHPNKEEVMNAQKGLSYTGERAAGGRIISPEKLMTELGFEFRYPDPRYFHL